MRQFFYLCIGLIIIALQALIGVRAFFPDNFDKKDNRVLEELLASKKPVVDKLSPEDLEFIANNQLVIAGVDPNFYPIEMYDERGRYTGLGADYLKLVSFLTGLEFQTRAQADWSATEESARKGEIQILPAAARTGRRSEYLLFTPPYISLPGIIMARRDNENAPSSLKELSGKKLAVTRDYAWHDFLREYHPDINVIPVANTLEALRLVSNGDADAVLDYEFNLLEKMRTAGIMQLEKTGEIQTNYGHAIGVHKTLPELFDIISLALAQITPEEHQKLAQKWLVSEQSQPENKQWQWIFFFFLEAVLLCLGLNMWIDRKVKRAVKKALVQCEDKTI